MSQSEPPSFHVRLSSALMKRIKIAAAENERSINAEIASRLENSFEVASADRQRLRSLLADALSLVDSSRRRRR